MGKLIAYQLVAVYESEDFIVQPAMMDCLLTRENLSANNGAGMFLSPAVVDKMRRGKVKLVDLEE